MELELAANSVTYILVTGLVDPKTDVTAFLGKGLNVVFVPIGDLDVARRRVHYEKVSELAHRDLRPDNLTKTSNSNTWCCSSTSSFVLAANPDVIPFLHRGGSGGPIAASQHRCRSRCRQFDGQHYFTMEFIEGISLDQKLADGPLSARFAARYVRILARAVAYAHRQGILHRDLKPSNILISSDDEPHITDFGLANGLVRKAPGERAPALRARRATCRPSRRRAVAGTGAAERRL